ncbi:SLC13 family permease [Poriferisphaera sp. WC338]|uniref:SLC13 family permease n=1 Tax=Poriferisphaera sp. WC338 TaxID=3425129 RepID=UPI003D817990
MSQSSSSASTATYSSSKTMPDIAPPSSPHKNLWLILGPVLAVIAYAVAIFITRQHFYSPSYAGEHDTYAVFATAVRPACITFAVTVLCAIWWVSEAVPIPVTSLVPFALFPILGVLSHKTVAGAYGNTFIFLFMAGFMLSKAAEKTDTHKKIAHTVLAIVGGHTAPRIILGFMIATAFCSMWISNTATAVMMLPVAIAVIDADKSKKLAVPLLLAIAYSASIGGMATVIGTPPNGVLLSIYQESTGSEIAFHEWMMVGLPISLILLAITWVYLALSAKLDQPIEFPATGKWTAAQKRVMIILAITATLWITRVLPGIGWAKALGITTVGDASIAILAVIMMFIIPAGDQSPEKRGEKLLDWPSAAAIPWGILLLFGGGLAIAAAFKSTGLTAAIGSQLTSLESLPVFLIILIICLGVTFLTEVTSNTATATLFLPIAYAASEALHLNPLILMTPAALSASCAFMLPVATPPNAVIFGAGHIHIRDMARKGFMLNIIAAVVIAVMVYWLVPTETIVIP